MNSKSKPPGSLFYYDCEFAISDWNGADLHSRGGYKRIYTYGRKKMEGDILIWLAIERE